MAHWSSIEHLRMREAKERASADASNIPFIKNVHLFQAERYAQLIAVIGPAGHGETSPVHRVSGAPASSIADGRRA